MMKISKRVRNIVFEVRFSWIEGIFTCLLALVIVAAGLLIVIGLANVISHSLPGLGLK